MDHSNSIEVLRYMEELKKNPHAPLSYFKMNIEEKEEFWKEMAYPFYNVQLRKDFHKLSVKFQKKILKKVPKYDREGFPSYQP